MSKNKKIILIFVILFVLVMVAGVTYAWLSWSKNISISGTSKCFDISYSKGSDISGDLVPVENPISNGNVTYGYGMIYSTFTIGMNNSCTTPADFTLTLKSTDLSSSFINGDSSGALKYVLVYTSSLSINSTYSVLSMGSINTTNDIIIYTGGITNDSNRTYSLIVYIDGDYAFDDAISSSYQGYVSVDAVQKTSYDVSGTLLDSSDNPIALATITLNSDIAAVTDSDGKYILSSVPLGEHSIEIKDSSNNVLTTDSITIESGNSNSVSSNSITIGSFRNQILNIKLDNSNSIDCFSWVNY